MSLSKAILLLKSPLLSFSTKFMIINFLIATSPNPSDPNYIFTQPRTNGFSCWREYALACIPVKIHLTTSIFLSSPIGKLLILQFFCEVREVKKF